MLKRLMEEVARPNGVAALFLVGILTSEAWVIASAFQGAVPSEAVMGFFLCVGGYAGPLWANRGGGDRR